MLRASKIKSTSNFMMEISPIIASILAGLCFVLCAAATGGNGWVENGSSDVGLWKYCASGTCTTIPSSSVSDKLKTIRAFMILAIISSLVAAVVGILMILNKFKISSIVLAAINTATAVFLIIALGIYTNEVEKGSGSDYAWCYALAWLSVFAAIAGIVLGVVMHMKKDMIVKVSAAF